MIGELENLDRDPRVPGAKVQASAATKKKLPKQEPGRKSMGAAGRRQVAA